MFHIDVTFEDCRVIAYELPPVEQEDGGQPVPNGMLGVNFGDMVSGRIWRTEMRLQDIMTILLVAATSDGQSDVEANYEFCNHLLSDCPPECRPLP